MNCATISAMLRSSTLAKCYNSPEERIISFECTKANHDKLPHENNSLTLITACQIALHIICIKFKVVSFENSFREFGTLGEVCEEIIKLHIFIFVCFYLSKIKPPNFMQALKILIVVAD